MILKSLFLALGFIILLDQSFAQAYLDRHSVVQSDAWISNTKSTSPNTIRGSLHWIRYDLGETYSLHKSKFWNVNTPGLLNAGARTVIIDYSLDGVTWFEWGRFILDQATGNSYYEGQEGPDFSGLAARYLLFNITNTHGHATYGGFAEVRVESTPTTVSVEDKNITEAIELKASPNPFSSVTKISIKNMADNSELTYQLTDITGKLLMKEKVDSDEIEISGRDLQTGLYYFSVIHKSGIKTIPIELIK